MTLKNTKHELFCQTYMTSPDTYVRYNATQSYLKVFLNANLHTASTHGSRLRIRYQERLLEIGKEQQMLHASGYQPMDYRRGAQKKFNPAQGNKVDHSQPSSIDPQPPAQTNLTFSNKDLAFEKLLNADSEPRKPIDWEDLGM